MIDDLNLTDLWLLSCQMCKSKVTCIKSGWKSVFMVFTSAAFDNPEMSANAFENVEQGLPLFGTFRIS